MNLRRKAELEGKILILGHVQSGADQTLRLLGETPKGPSVLRERVSQEEQIPASHHPNSSLNQCHLPIFSLFTEEK
jgi:hypothetical protein